MQKIQVWSLGWETPQRTEWQPTPVFLPGIFHGQRSLAGCSPWRESHDSGVRVCYQPLAGGDQARCYIFHNAQWSSNSSPAVLPPTGRNSKLFGDCAALSSIWQKCHGQSLASQNHPLGHRTTCGMMLRLLRRWALCCCSSQPPSHVGWGPKSKEEESTSKPGRNIPSSGSVRSSNFDWQNSGICQLAKKKCFRVQFQDYKPVRWRWIWQLARVFTVHFS